MVRYFGHPTGQAGDYSRAQNDADEDGMTNWQEYLTGTDPTDPTSVFRLQISVQAVSGNNVVLTWPAAPGKSYQVRYKDNLTDRRGWTQQGLLWRRETKAALPCRLFRRSVTTKSR
jgi:hypothetical protein